MTISEAWPWKANYFPPLRHITAIPIEIRNKYRMMVADFILFWQ